MQTIVKNKINPVTLFNLKALKQVDGFLGSKIFYMPFGAREGFQIANLSVFQPYFGHFGHFWVILNHFEPFLPFRAKHIKEYRLSIHQDGKGNPKNKTQTFDLYI